ncbi:6889_t:CDS:2 [Diversispora eburnea]|uniref:small monomeric GTPase n=1 Tax=Diversispora eburnea TaxID=1213867 RepID=A0A9N8UZH9_9GLOM|nr:6889_t:CDS:2 [Diversispora eburnea]
MDQYQIVVLGDTTESKYNTSTIDTIDDAFEMKLMIDNLPCVVKLLDGNKTDALILVYSIISFEKFRRIEHYCKKIFNSITRTTFSTPIIIVGDNLDKVNEREVSRNEGLQLAEKYKCEFLEVSTKTALNVEKCIHTLVRMIRRNNEDEKNMNLKDWNGKERNQDTKIMKCNIFKNVLEM